MSEVLLLEIYKLSIVLGEDEVVKILVGQLFFGNFIWIEVYVFCVEAFGLALLVMVGIYGDEINGVEIVCWVF